EAAPAAGAAAGGFTSVALTGCGCAPPQATTVLAPSAARTFTNLSIERLGRMAQAPRLTMLETYYEAGVAPRSTVTSAVSATLDTSRAVQSSSLPAGSRGRTSYSLSTTCIGCFDLISMRVGFESAAAPEG